MSNSRLSISLHILTLLDQAKDEMVSSEYLARSININPVLVRKEISNLKKHGLVQSKEGKSGGFTLGKAAKQISLSDIYRAVQKTPLFGLQKNKPNPKCPVGKQISKHLDDLYSDAEDALVKKLGKTTLSDFAKKFY